MRTASVELKRPSEMLGNVPKRFYHFNWLLKNLRECHGLDSVCVQISEQSTQDLCKHHKAVL